MALTDYRLRSVTKGKEALGEAHVELEHSGRKIRGRGLSTDVLEASARAYIAAVNRLRSLSNREKQVAEQTKV
jgi:2-isopropylmalate synthase